MLVGTEVILCMVWDEAIFVTFDLLLRILASCVPQCY